MSRLQIGAGISISNLICVWSCMYVYADPECYFFLPVKFEAAPVNRNDSELMCNCFIEVRNTTLRRRNGIYSINRITMQNIEENNPDIPVNHTCLMLRYIKET
jgi:hypothetical protein